MHRILQQLNQEVGVKGSMVVGEDGLVVMAELSEELDGEIVAAMASKMVRSTKRSLSLLGNANFDRSILVSSQGRIVLVNIEPASLLVIAEKNINLDYTLLAINGAARRIKNMWNVWKT